MEKTSINKKRRKYDESFKAELLRMVKSGRSVAEVSRAISIGENLLYKWKSKEKSQETLAEALINVEIEQLRKQLRQVETERDILKNSFSHFRSGDLTKTYKVIDLLSSEYPIRLLCIVLNVCFSVFYMWKRKLSYVLSKLKAELSEKVKEVFEEHRSRYGAIRISKELKAQGIRIGRYQTQTLMKTQNLVAIQRQRPTA